MSSSYRRGLPCAPIAGDDTPPGLFDPRREHDACGVGFIVDLAGRKSHQIVADALSILENLEHRGAVGADPIAGDGAGLLLQIPHDFLARECGTLGFELPAPGQYAVGHLFMPQDARLMAHCERVWTRIIRQEGLELLGWRSVPVDNSCLSQMVKATEPVHRQVFIACPASIGDEAAFERQLYLVRKVVSNAMYEAYKGRDIGYYTVSLSSRPGRKALATSQDRLTEKTFLQGLGLQVAPFAPVQTRADLDDALAQIGTPAILKTRRMGYDGKGQARIMATRDADAAFADMAGADAVLEGFVQFSQEVSVIGARGLDGSIACYDPGENVHEAGILRTSSVPAKLTPGQRTDAVLIAARILNALDYVGVLGVELFVTAGGLIVNEIAPRVHNSGHWTQNGCVIDQFEQHIRAVAGWPLGDGSRHSNVVMENLIGDDVLRLSALAKTNVALHLYGKAQAKPGRKMGHVNRVTGAPT